MKKADSDELRQSLAVKISVLVSGASIWNPFGQGQIWFYSTRTLRKLFQRTRP